MKAIDFGSLPPGTVVRGTLYDDPSFVYESGDVIEVELPSGMIIDVGWDERHDEEPFRIVVYRQYFGDHFIDFRVCDVQEVVNSVVRLAREHSGPFVASACSTTNDSGKKIPFMGTMITGMKLAASVAGMGFSVASNAGG